jgi:hypothetical protein
MGASTIRYYQVEDLLDRKIRILNSSLYNVNKALERIEKSQSQTYFNTFLTCLSSITKTNVAIGLHICFFASMSYLAFKDLNVKNCIQNVSTNTDNVDKNDVATQKTEDDHYEIL